MRHATVMAVKEIFPWLDLDADGVNGRRACDWSQLRGDDIAPFFDVFAAIALLDGKEVHLPTCPACACLVDLALEMRGSR